MKKFVVVLIFILLAVSALSVSAQYDLSELSYSDLQNLVALAQKEMMTRSEFQEVTVPPGLYKVGVEIPAGKWTLILPPSDKSYASASVNIGDKLDEGQNSISLWDSNSYDYIYLKQESPNFTVTLLEGYYVEVEDNVIFSTPIGVSFSFK